MNLIEDYDDSDERVARIEAKEKMARFRDEQHGEALLEDAARSSVIAHIQAYLAQPVRCPYCTFAKKGGAHGDLDHKDHKGVTHKVRVVREIPTGKMSMTVWVMDAACGAEFTETVDSGD